MRKIAKALWRWGIGGLIILLLGGCGFLHREVPDEKPVQSRQVNGKDGEARQIRGEGAENENAKTESPEESPGEGIQKMESSEKPGTFRRRDSSRIWNSPSKREELYSLPGEQLQILRWRAYWLRKERFNRILESEEKLPARYDAREEGRTALVEDQGELGTCWSFASLTALENALLPKEEWDFSEDHMSHNPNFALGQKKGGEYTMSMAYLLSWLGPVTEEQDPYGDGVSPEGLLPVKHVQEIRILPENDREMIKRGVLACGGIQSSLYTTMQNGQSQSEHYNEETCAYCYPYKTEHNHDIVIVGWDDNFPKEAFRTEVEGNGAFLCENSWGKEFGENGFFYVSYYDANLGGTNIIYTGIESTDNYGGIYQSDLCGWIGQMGYGEDTAWAANIYTASQSEEVAAVGFYATGENTSYQIYVKGHISQDPASQLKDRPQILAEGKLSQAGYYTIPLNKGVSVDAGERFAVVIRLTTPGSVHPIAIEYDPGDGKSHINLEDGEGYISFEGAYWERAEEKQSCNICLKAYTIRKNTEDNL